jgi:hypothetical protein
MKNNKIEKLASEKSNPCVTISMNTHRTHPDNAQDVIGLKNLLKEAKERVISEFGKRSVNELLEKIDSIEKEIDVNYNLDSLHIFLSNSTKELVKSPWPTLQNSVYISESFAIKPLIKIFNRTEEYLVLLFSQSGVKLFRATNDTISEEIKNQDFPMPQHKIVDHMVDEFLNKIDKAVVKVYNETDMNCVVICTEENYNHLINVADKPSIYYGYANINSHDTSNHTISNDAWEIVNAIHEKYRAEAIREIEESVGKGKVITDLSEIFHAAMEGRGDLLIVHNDFHQAVKMTGDYSFELVNDVTQHGVIDDITSDIAWEVISKKGRAIFTTQDEIKSLGNIVLKVRY